MATQGLLFIPDISGFSRFVNETEIDHSRLIVQELLETLIDANEIGLEISEIEGDAILFYRFGDVPDLKELSTQVERMFCAFQRNILAYDVRKYCQCPACLGVAGLTLKVITHYGEFTGYSVKAFNKLIGRDVIVAHELLKNDIEPHEYWLVTQSVAGDEPPPDLAEWLRWSRGAKRIRGGDVSFHYTWLGPLRETVAREPAPQADLTGRVRLLSASREYETDILTLFHVSGDFNYRDRWRDGVRRVEEVEPHLPRVGMRCRCLLHSGERVMYASSYSYSPDRIEFTEVDERNDLTRYVLERLGDSRTRLTLEYHLPKDLAAGVILRPLRKRGMQRSFQRSLENLAGLVREMGAAPVPLPPS